LNEDNSKKAVGWISNFINENAISLSQHEQSALHELTTKCSLMVTKRKDRRPIKDSHVDPSKISTHKKSKTEKLNELVDEIVTESDVEMNIESKINANNGDSSRRYNLRKTTKPNHIRDAPIESIELKIFTETVVPNWLQCDCGKN